MYSTPKLKHRERLTFPGPDPSQTQCPSYKVSVCEHISQAELVMFVHGVEIEEVAHVNVGVAVFGLGDSATPLVLWRHYLL